MDNLLPFEYHDVRLPPSRQVPLHSQSTWELSLIVKGQGDRLLGDTSDAFCEGDIALIPPEICHCWQFDPTITDGQGNIANITLTFLPEFLSGLSGLFPVLAKGLRRMEELAKAVTFDGRTAAYLSERLIAMRRMTDEQRIAPVLEIIGRIIRSLDSAQVAGHRTSSDRKQIRLMQIKTYVACNYMRSISIDDIARHLGMNKTSFCAFFRRATGRTFIDYLNDYRLRQARYLLSVREEGVTVSDICYRTGFQTVSHFNHLFRRKYGAAPGKMKIKSF